MADVTNDSDAAEMYYSVAGYVSPTTKGTGPLKTKFILQTFLGSKVTNHIFRAPLKGGALHWC
jgi:hypothetical protein